MSNYIFNYFSTSLKEAKIHNQHLDFIIFLEFWKQNTPIFHKLRHFFKFELTYIKPLIYEFRIRNFHIKKISPKKYFQKNTLNTIH
jgi:hypothetical protein